MSNFASVLDKPSNEIARPKPMPVGSYICITQGLPKIDKAKTGTEFSKYELKYVQAGPDVEQDDLDKVLTKITGEKVSITEKGTTITFYHTEDSLWRLKRFFEHLDIPEEDDEGEVYTMRQRMQMTPNRQIGINIKHSGSEDGEAVYANVDSTFKVE